jgi:hypothetical protein
MVEQNNVVANQSGVLVEQNKLLLNQNQEAVKQSETVIRQNKLSKARNSSLAFLTGVTTVLLPFTTIATYMAIPVENGLGPRSKDQWIYWISSGLLATVLIFTFLIGYRCVTCYAQATHRYIYSFFPAFRAPSFLYIHTNIHHIIPTAPSGLDTVAEVEC